MNKSYIMSVTHEAVKLYGGRLEDNGTFTAFEDSTKNTVEEICAQDCLKTHKTNIKLGVIFSPSFSQVERERLLDDLHHRGFAESRELSLSSYICDYIKGHPYALILSADKDDLYVEYTDTQTQQVLAHAKFNDAGRDPRIEVLAEVIWKKLVAESSYLSKEDCFEAVKETAQSFLLSGKPELEGNLFLEGENHEFFVRRRDADIDNLMEHGSASILSELSNFANHAQLNKANTILVLTKGLAGNSYFHAIFNGFASDIKETNEEWTKAILSSMLNDLQGISHPNSNDAIGIDGLPLQNIKFTPSDTSVFFDITFPKGVQAIDIYRDGEKKRTITHSQFRDTDLVPSHTYTYGFILLLKDENGYESSSAESKINITTTAQQLPEPVSLSIQENEEEVILSWSNPSKGIVRVFHSPRPFPFHENDVIQEVNALDYPALSTSSNTFRIKKDYCGERFFVPVTIVDNIGVAGKPQAITSMIPPKGTRIDSTDVKHVKVVWIWDNIPMVRIKWITQEGNEQWKDIIYDGQAPEFELPLSSLSRNFTIIVTALYQKDDGTMLESEKITLKVSLSAAKVNFVSAKSEARFFLHKDEYTLTLKADSEPPCDLYVLLGEGAIPLDLTNFKSYLTISRHDLADGTEKKFPLTYHRAQRGQPLYFRIIAADRSLPLKVVPETQKIK